MPFPASWDLGTVYGTFVDSEGDPLVGQIVFKSRARRVTAAGSSLIVLPSTVYCPLDANGYFTADIPASMDADTNPTGFTWRVYERVPGGGSYDIEVEPGGSLDLNTVVAVDPSTGAAIIVGPPGPPGDPGEYFTAKGDLIVATGLDTGISLPVGTNGQALVADSGETSGVKWADAAGVTTLDGLTDVNAPSPSNTQVLAWASSPGEWAPSTLTVPADLDDLGDVTAPSPNPAQMLAWSGSAWVPTDQATVPADLADLDDVAATVPSAGQALVWSGSTWAPGDVSGGTVTSPSIVQSDSASDTDGDVTVVLGLTPVEGNLLLRFERCNTGSFTHDTTGWTELDMDITPPAGGTVRCLWKVAGASETTSFQATTAASAAIDIVVIELQDSDAESGPMYFGYDEIVTGEASGSVSLTATESDSLLIGVALVSANPTFGSTPAGWSDISAISAIRIRGCTISGGGDVSVTYTWTSTSVRGGFIVVEIVAEPLALGG